MASTDGVSNSPIAVVLKRNNYKTWRSLIETYLLAKDLWEVIEANTEPAADVEDEYKAWRRKNAEALYAIQSSCELEMLKFVSEVKMAKSAWQILQEVSTRRERVEAENFEPYIEFTEFVTEGDWDKAKECLKRKDLDLHSAATAVDPRDNYGNSAIHIVAWKGHLNIFKDQLMMLTHEELKMVNAQGYTAIHIAAGNGKVAIVKELVFLMGEKVSYDGDTALHWAVKNAMVDCVKVLVTSMRQTDMKIKNNDGYTALHVAVVIKHVTLVKILAALMGEVRGPGGDTALHMAVRLGATNLVKELLLSMRREDMAICNDEGYTAFHLAVNKGSVPIVKEFIPKETERDFRSSYTDFTRSIIRGEWDNAMRFLTELDDPCDAITVVDPRGQYGDTALHAAVRAGHVHIVKEMISRLQVRQDNLELKTAEDFMVFGQGIKSGVTEEVLMKNARYMVEQLEKMLNSILEVQNTEGNTALHLAAWYGNVDIVKELAPLMTHEGLELKESQGLTPLMAAVDKGHLDTLRELLPMMRQTGLEIKTDKEGWNALHQAIINNDMNIVKEVMPYMRKESLEELENTGFTALGGALALFKDEDVMEIAKYMAENNTKVFGIPVPPINWIPVAWVTNQSRWSLCRDLYALTPLEYLIPKHKEFEDGGYLVIECLRARQFDMVIHLLQRCTKLDMLMSLIAADEHSFIMELARMGSAFPSGTQLTFWQRLIYNRLSIEPVDLTHLSTLHSSINISHHQINQDRQFDLTHSVTSLYKKLVHSLSTLLGVIQLREMKLIHIRCLEILSCIVKMVKKEHPTAAQHEILRRSMIKAVEHGNVEFVTQLCEACPSLLNGYSSEVRKTIIHFAVEYRQHKIYNLVYRIDKEDMKKTGCLRTKGSENIFHLVGELSPLSSLNRIRCAALQMQRELQWFKEIEDIVSPDMREVPNSDGMTPHEIFTKNHGTLQKEAEDSLKGTASSCTVVGALLVTMMFAAAFTSPGGSDGNTGYPMFVSKKLFLLFIISDIVSLVSSTTSVITFLGVLASRYAEDDFLKSLPVKMMIGLSTLFISIVTMMITFSSALIIMLQREYSWATIPTILATSIPVASYIWFLFPLLIETLWSTYGPGLFEKKLKKGKPLIKISLVPL